MRDLYHGFPCLWGCTANDTTLESLDVSEAFRDGVRLYRGFDHCGLGLSVRARLTSKADPHHEFRFGLGAFVLFLAKPD